MCNFIRTVFTMLLPCFTYSYKGNYNEIKKSDWETVWITTLVWPFWQLQHCLPRTICYCGRGKQQKVERVSTLFACSYVIGLQINSAWWISSIGTRVIMHSGQKHDKRNKPYSEALRIVGFHSQCLNDVCRFTRSTILEHVRRQWPWSIEGACIGHKRDSIPSTRAR